MGFSFGTLRQEVRQRGRLLIRIAPQYYDPKKGAYRKACDAQVFEVRSPEGLNRIESVLAQLTKENG